jgi:transcription elongation GreA/GreB family factor
MSKDLRQQLVLADDDHKELTEYINLHRNRLLTQPGMAELILDIEKAVVVPALDFPWDTIRLNSKAIIRDKIARINYTYIPVMPDHSDHRKCRVSVFSTIGKSLLGKKRGEDILWDTPVKKRYFTVMAISHHKLDIGV